MNKSKFILPLLIAIVMMAMSPQRLWAENCKHTSTGVCSKCGVEVAYLGDDANAEGTANAIHWELWKNAAGKYDIKITGQGALKDYERDDNFWVTAPWIIGYKNVGWPCPYTSVDVGSGITRIGKNAFNSYSTLTSVTLPEGLESIGESAFAGVGNGNLTELVIPSTVNSIDAHAFGYAAIGTLKFTSNSKPQQLNLDAFNGMTGKVSYPGTSGWNGIEESGLKGTSNITWDKRENNIQSEALTWSNTGINVSISSLKEGYYYYSFTPTATGKYFLELFPKDKMDIGLYSDDKYTSLITEGATGSCTYKVMVLNLEAGTTYYLKVHVDNATSSTQGNNGFTISQKSETAGTFVDPYVSAEDAHTWTYNNGVLTISGNKPLGGFLLANTLPYVLHKDNLKKIVLESTPSLFYVWDNNKPLNIFDGVKCETICFSPSFEFTHDYSVFDNCEVQNFYIAGKCVNTKKFAYGTFKTKTSSKNIYFLSQDFFNRANNSDSDNKTSWGTLYAPVTISLKIGEDVVIGDSCYRDGKDKIASYTLSGKHFLDKGLVPCNYRCLLGEETIEYGRTFTNITQDVVLVAEELEATDHKYVNGICDVCLDQPAVLTELILNDGTDYKRTISSTVTSLTYNRTFSSDNWQALYVPFQMEYSDWNKNFYVATIQNFHEYTDENGEVQNTVIEVRYVKSGKLKANHPYLIKPKTAGEKTILLSNATLAKAESASIVCQSMERRYTFTGTYLPVQNMVTNDCLFITGGKLMKASSDATTLKAQRWYLKIEDLGSQLKPTSQNAKTISISVLDDDEATGIEDIQVISTPLSVISATAIYNLQGRRQQSLVKGINIVRHADGSVKKVMVK